MESDFHILPKRGFKGLKQNWQHDLVAAVSVTLVALPLAIGIALAAGAPAISGLVSVLVAGFVTTFIRGGHVSINGPGNSLIVVIASAIFLLSDGSENVFSFVLAAFVVSGVIQTVLGLLKMGMLGYLFPSSVVSGLLAAIGIIIISKQINVAFGVDAVDGTVIDVFTQVPQLLIEANPFILFIAAVSLLIMVWHSKMKSRLVHAIPAPIWVLFFALPVVSAFNYLAPIVSVIGSDYHIGSQFMVDIPDDIIGSLIFPNFSRIGDLAFWQAVIIITIVPTIETLISAKAVDKLDPYKRETNLNKDLIGMGVSSVISAFCGGLPIQTVIARSSVNINHGARTKWSNFFQGLLLLIIILLFSSFIQLVPMAALAAILIYTGYKLISPHVFKDAYLKGIEQILILLVTIGATIYTNLILGIVIGIAFTLFVQILKSNMSVRLFLGYMFKNPVHTLPDRNKDHFLKVKGVSNFVNLLPVAVSLNKLAKQESVILDFSNTYVADYSVLEYVHDFADKYQREGGQFEITGLSIHTTSSDHPNALHILMRHKLQKPRLTKRQSKLKEVCANHGWMFQPFPNWNISFIRKFRYFETRPIEYKTNTITGKYTNFNVEFEISDITFDEGALSATEVYHTTLEFIKLPSKIPVFTLEEEDMIDRVIDFAKKEDVDLDRFKKFSRKFVLKGKSRDQLQSFFTNRVLDFLEFSEVYHMESTGSELCIFRYTRLASPEEIEKMSRFTEEFLERIDFDRPLDLNVQKIKKPISK